MHHDLTEVGSEKLLSHPMTDQLRYLKCWDLEARRQLRLFRTCNSKESVSWLGPKSEVDGVTDDCFDQNKQLQLPQNMLWSLGRDVKCGENDGQLRFVEGNQDQDRMQWLAMLDQDRLELRPHSPPHNSYCRPVDCSSRHLAPIHLLSDHNMRSENWRTGTSSSVLRSKTGRGSTQSWLSSWPGIAGPTEEGRRGAVVKDSDLGGVLMIAHQNEMRMNSECKWMSREMMKKMMMERVRGERELEPALKRQARDSSPPIQSHRHIPLSRFLADALSAACLSFYRNTRQTGSHLRRLCFPGNSSLRFSCFQ